MIRGRFLEDDHFVPRARELLRARQSGRPADDRRAFAGFVLRRLRLDPAVLPALSMIACRST